MKSYLTGEYVDEAIGRRRPVAVMLNNIQAAIPQAGISNAGVIYEAPVEGGITRLMAVMEDYDNLEKIGSMRSCRDYYIFYAAGFNAIYVHYGQSAYALPILELPEVNKKLKRSRQLYRFGVLQNQRPQGAAQCLYQLRRHPERNRDLRLQSGICGRL